MLLDHGGCVSFNSCSSTGSGSVVSAHGGGGGGGGEEVGDLRRGPWTVDEDLLLVNYISRHGEGRWNSLARSAGLRRTGKSCRLRWLNYLRPDVRRGNITPEEQLLILDLHSRWGNRWSKIAHHLPGRTDNEIKNYWRTRVQKNAKQLNCDVNSQRFKDIIKNIWMPRLMEKIRANSSTPAAAAAPLVVVNNNNNNNDSYSPCEAPVIPMDAGWNEFVMQVLEVTPESSIDHQESSMTTTGPTASELWSPPPSMSELATASDIGVDLLTNEIPAAGAVIDDLSINGWDLSDSTVLDYFWDGSDF